MEMTHENASDPASVSVHPGKPSSSDSVSCNGRLSSEDQFAAWCEWRKWCSVARVLEPYSLSERHENGWKDDLSYSVRMNYCSFLRNIVYGRAKDIAARCGIALGQTNAVDADDDLSDAGNDSCFDRSGSDLTDCSPDDATDEFSDDRPNLSPPEQEDDEINNWPDSDADDANDGVPRKDEMCFSVSQSFQDSAQTDYIQFFDSYMRGLMPQKKVNGISVSYKDYIFHLISEYDDPPLQIINGKILGKKSGYIIDLTKAYIRSNFQVTVQNGKIHVLDSLDRAIDENGETLLKDVVPGSQDDDAVENDSDGIRVLYRRLDLSREEKIILVALSYKTAISNPALLNVLGFKKEASQNKLNGVRKKMLQYRDDLNTPRAMEQIISLIFEDFFDDPAEKDTYGFLMGMVNRLEQANHSGK